MTYILVLKRKNGSVYDRWHTDDYDEALKEWKYQKHVNEEVDSYEIIEEPNTRWDSPDMKTEIRTKGWQ